MAFAIDRKLSAGVNASLQISSSELNRRLMLKSAASFRMRRDPADSSVSARQLCGTYPLRQSKELPFKHLCWRRSGEECPVPIWQTSCSNSSLRISICT